VRRWFGTPCCAPHSAAAQHGKSSAQCLVVGFSAKNIASGEEGGGGGVFTSDVVTYWAVLLVAIHRIIVSTTE